MNSWDCSLPSPEMFHLHERARAAAERVQAARLEHRLASPQARDFWVCVLADRIAEAEAIEAIIREKKRRRTGTPDALAGDHWLP